MQLHNLNKKVKKKNLLFYQEYLKLISVLKYDDNNKLCFYFFFIINKFF